MLFVLVLRILPPINFQTLQPSSPKKLTFQNFHTIFHVRKLVSVQYNQIILQLIASE